MTTSQQITHNSSLRLTTTIYITAGHTMKHKDTPQHTTIQNNTQQDTASHKDLS